MKQLARRIESFLDRNKRFGSLLLRIGLAFVLAYAAIASIISPNDWIGYVPAFVREIIPATTVLGVLTIAQLLVALWLLSGIYIRLAALACAAMLADIIVANPNLLAITFRDIGLLFAALALAAIGKPRSSKP